MPHNKSYFLLLTSFFLLLTSCINDGDDTPVAFINVGNAVPAFQLTASDGSTVTSTSLAGSTYILNFFDTTCPDCQRGLNQLQRIYDTHGQEVTVLNVPRSQTKKDLQAYWQKAGLTMPFHIPADKDLYYKFATATIPRTYVIDAAGKVAAAFDDSPVADYDTLASYLSPLTSHLSLRLRVQRADDEYYFHNEYIISRLEVWFFDADTKQFYTKAVLTDLTEELTPNTQYDITYMFDNIRLTAGVYDIFAIANYDYSPDSVAVESELLDMVDSLTYREGIEANIPDKGAVMTSSATALLGIDLTPYAGDSYLISVDLERVVAKMQIGVAQNTFQLMHGPTKYAEINLTNYKLVNLNRLYYLFQHVDTIDGSGYVVDPLFYQKTPDTGSVSKFSQYYKSWYGNFTTDDFTSMPAADNYGYAYVLENTAPASSQKNGYSPGIVFKAAVSPVFVYLYDTNLKTLREEYRPEYWPNTIYLYRYNFYGSLQAVNAASGLALDELATYTDAQLKPYAIKQCRFNMGVYETYYTYWIRHRNATTDPMGPMQYGLVRNNFYRIVVKGVSGLGNSTVPPDVLRDNYPNSYVDIEE